MAPRLRRFLHLERPRPTAPDGEASLPAPERFGGAPAPEPERAKGDPFVPSVGPQGGPESRHENGSAARSRFLRPDLRAPDVAPVPADAQPFVRCMRCEADASRYAARCPTCGEELDTPAQRAFNEKLWAERRRVAEEEERALASQRAARAEADAEAVRARREMGELLAAETGRRERERLDAEDGGRRWGRWSYDDDAWSEGDRRPLGVRLLGLVRDPRWRIGIAVAALVVLVAAGLVAFLARSPLPIFALVAILSVLFSPPRRRRPWWR